jgi:hypothetical protein
MNLSTYLVDTHDDVEVVSPTTSGEIEYVLLRDGRDMWVTVGSDQTDRDVETSRPARAIRPRVARLRFPRAAGCLASGAHDVVERHANRC